MYHNLGEFTRMWGILFGGVSDCEELDACCSQEKMRWLNRKGLLSVLPVFADQRI